MVQFQTVKAVLISGLVMGAATVANAQSAPPADAWQIGPIIKGRNYSVGMPASPTANRRGQGWSFAFPNPTVDAGHVHYVTFRNGSLAGKHKIIMRYRIDAPRDTKFIPREQPNLPGTIRLYFQRQGDKWTGRGRQRWYRWYAPNATVRELAPGVYTMEANLNVTGWVPVSGGMENGFTEAFNDALEHADRVGFVMGSRVAAGHGVYTDKQARFTLLSFDVM